MKKILLLLPFVAFCFQVSATQFYWVGASGANWSVATNWKMGSFTGSMATTHPRTSVDSAFMGNGSVNATVTLDSSFSIQALFLKGSGQLFINGSGKTLTLSGNLIITNTGTSGGGTSTLNFAGTDTIVGNATLEDVGKLPNVTFASGSNIVLKGYITMGGSTTLTNAGATITAGNSTIVFYYNNTIVGNPVIHSADFQGTGSTFTVSDSLTLIGNLTFSSSGQFYINTGKIKLDSNLIFTNTYSYTSGTATIVMEGSANQTYSHSGNSGFCDWKINKTGGSVTPATGTTNIICGAFILTAGSFTAPTGNFILAAGTYASENIFTQSATGTSFNANGGTVQFNPTGNYNTFTVAPAPTTRFHNVVINGMPYSHTIAVASAAGDTVKVQDSLSFVQGYLNGIWEVKRNISISATANQGIGTIIMDSSINATYAYSIAGAAGGCFLTINKSGGATVSAAPGTTQLWVAGLNIVNGTFTAPSGTLYLGQSYDGNDPYTLFQQTGGTFNNNHGLVKFVQTSNSQTYTVAAPATTHFNNVEVALSTVNYTPFITTASGDTIRVDSAFYHTSGYLMGNWMVSGNLVIGTGSNSATGNIFMVGSNNATYSYTSGTGTSFLTVNKSGGATVSPASGTTNLQIGALYVVNGTFNAPAGTLFLANSRDGSSNALFKQTGGAFNANSGLVKFTQGGNGTTFTVYVNSSTRFYNVECALGVVNYPPHLVSASGDTIYVMNNFTMAGGYIDGIWKVFGNITVSSTYNYGGQSQLFISGSGNQTFNDIPGTSLYKIIMNKPGGTFTLQTLLSPANNLTLLNGIINCNGNTVILLNGTTVTGGSNNSFVSGAVEKIGNQAFKFPLGDATAHLYKPISISAPSTTSDAFTAQYYNTGIADGLDGVLTYTDPCEHWNIAHTTGSSTVHDTLFWNNPCFHIASLSYFKIGYVSGSTWTSVGTCSVISGSTPTLGGISASFVAGNVTLAKTNPLVYAHAGNDTAICSGLSATLHGTVTGGTSPFTYSWSPATGLSSSTNATPTATPTVTTTYILTVTDNLTEFGMDTIVVTVNPNPMAHAGRDTLLCYGLSAAIGASPAATGGTSPYNYSWSPATGLSSSTIAQPTANPTITTPYILTVTDNNGCANKDTINLTINPLLIVNAGNDTTVFPRDTVTLGGAPSATGGQSPYQYSWVSVIGLNSSTGANPVTLIYTATSYILNVTDANNCKSADTISVKLNLMPRDSVYVNANMDTLELILSQPYKNFYDLKQAADAYIKRADSLGIDIGGDDEDGTVANYYRWVTYWEKHVGKNGSFKDAERAMKDYLNSATTPLFDCSTSPATTEWKCIGPNTDVSDEQDLGRITAIAKDLSGNVYAGSNNGGLYESAGGTGAWTNLTDGTQIAGLGVASIIIHPDVTSNALIIGLNSQFTYDGHGFNATYGSYTGGIWVSTDGGSTWNTTFFNTDVADGADPTAPAPIPSPWTTDLTREYIAKIVIDPTSTLTDTKLYIIRRSRLQFYELDCTNPTATPIALITCETLPYGVTFQDMEIDPTNSNRVWVSSPSGLECWVNDNGVLTPLPAITKFGSVDYSQSINYSNGCSIGSLVNNTLSFELKNQGGFLYIYGLVNFSKNTAYCTNIYDVANYTIVSTDGGVTFTSTLTAYAPLANTNGCYDLFKVNDLNYNVFYATDNVGIIRTVNQGATWPNPENPGNCNGEQDNIHVDFRSILPVSYSADGADVIYAGTDGGLLELTYPVTTDLTSPTYTNLNGTGSIADQNGLTVGNYYNIGIDPYYTNQKFNMFTGAQDGSYQRWENDAVPSFDPNNECIGDAGDAKYGPDVLYAMGGAPYSSINVSVDGGTTWIENKALQDANGNKAVNCTLPIDLNPANENSIFSGLTDLFYYRRNSSNSSIYASKNLTPDLNANFISDIKVNSDTSAVYFSQFGNNYYSGNSINYNGGIFKVTGWSTSTPTVTNITSNLTSTTINDASPLNYGAITSVCVSPNAPDTLWVGFGGYEQISGTNYKVFESDDGGTTWNNISNGLPNLPINCLYYQKGSNKIIYAGTDIGVYYYKVGYSDIPSKWYRYCNMPTAPVSDIDFNYCEGKIYASTYGHGIFEGDMIANADYVISTDKTIIGYYPITNDLYITGGATVTFQGANVNVSNGHAIFVEPGSRLVVDNSVITNYCGDIWGGINVVGDVTHNQLPASHPTYQGSILVENGSTIENSNYGIVNWDYAHDNTSTWGGVIQAKDSYFLNNISSAGFMEYQNHSPSGSIANDLSYFRNCSFKVDNNYRGGSSFWACITMWDVYGINISGCTFENDMTTPVGNNRGILSIDAGYSVSSYCTESPDDPCLACSAPYLIPSKFKGFEEAIDASNGSTTTHTTYVSQAVFTDNGVGVDLKGVNNATVVQSTFSIGGYAVSGYSNQFGIKATIASGYTIEENTITGTNTSKHIEGINITEGGMAHNQTYKNTIENCNVAQHAIGLNRDFFDPAGGLEFLCNTQEGSINDDILIECIDCNIDGIKQNQGSQKVAAGNTFSSGANYNIYNGSAWEVEYYYDPSASNAFPTNKNSLLVNTATALANSCPSHYSCNYLPIPHLALVTDQFPLFHSAVISYTPQASRYISLIDGGSTPALLSVINSLVCGDCREDESEQTIYLENTLNAISPYVSQTALLAAASTGLLDDTDLFSICLQNIDATRSQHFLDMIDGSELSFSIGMPVHLSDDMVDSIQTHWRDSTARTGLEDSLSTTYSLMNYYANSIIASEEQDTTYDNLLIDSVRVDRKDIIDYYDRVQYLFSKGSFDSGEVLLDSLPLLFNFNHADSLEFTNYKNLFTLIVAARNDSRNLNSLNETEIEELESLRDNATGRSSTQAGNILCFFYQICTNDSGEAERMEPLTRKSKPVTTLKPNQITVVPNPTDDHLNFVFNAALVRQNGELMVTDEFGRTITVMPITKGQQQQFLDTNQLSPGLYFYQFKSNNATLEKGKFVVQR